MAPRNTNKKTSKTSNWRTLEESVELWTHIRLRKWCKSAVNGMVREFGRTDVWDEVNMAGAGGVLIPIGIAEAARLHGLDVNMQTGALVYDGKDIEGTDDATWNKAPAPGEMAPLQRLAVLNIRAQAVGLNVPESNDLDAYEQMILAAEGRATKRVSINVQPENVTQVVYAQPVTPANGPQ
jgi:hypothetical protein